MLISGAGAPSTFWFDGFVLGLVSAGYHVIRFDHRDCGLSTHLRTTPSPYTIYDLGNDILCILEAYDLQKAHMVGHSMGGHLVQVLGIMNPDRCETLTILSATDGIDPQVPPMAPETWKILTQTMPTQDFKRDLPDFLKRWRFLHGAVPLDEDLAIAYTKSLYDRDPDLKPAFNHIYAVSTIGYIRDKLATIPLKTLVIHGSEDNLQSVEGGRIIAQEVPGATLEVLVGVGHMFFSYQIWKQILEAVLKHLNKP